MKRAQAKMVLPPVFIAALGLGVVFLSILYAVFQIANNEAYLRHLYITGLGLDLQALQALGNDINAERDITDAGAYYLVFEGSQVYTRERGAQTSTFIFTQVPGMIFQGGEFSPQKGKTIGPLKLYKTGKYFGVAKPENVPSKYLLNCDTERGQPLNTIALDPGHGYDSTTGEGDSGYNLASPAITEAKYTLRLANELRAGKPRFNPTRPLDQDSHICIKCRDSTAGDAMISLHVGSRTDNQDVAKAYYNKVPESKRLACEMLNKITEEFNIPVRLVPIDTQYISTDDPKKILATKRPAVLLELGNAQKTDSILNKIPELALAIYKGIENYGIQTT